MRRKKPGLYGDDDEDEENGCRHATTCPKWLVLAHLELKTSCLKHIRESDGKDLGSRACVEDIKLDEEA